MEDKVVDVYCHMTMGTTGNDACGDGGWTLVITNGWQPGNLTFNF